MTTLTQHEGAQCVYRLDLEVESSAWVLSLSIGPSISTPPRWHQMHTIHVIWSVYLNFVDAVLLVSIAVVCQSSRFALSAAGWRTLELLEYVLDNTKTPQIVCDHCPYLLPTPQMACPNSSQRRPMLQARHLD